MVNKDLALGIDDFTIAIPSKNFNDMKQWWLSTHSFIFSYELNCVVLSFHCFHYSIVIIYLCVYANCDHVMLK